MFRGDHLGSFSPIMMEAALVFPLTTFGMMLASATRR